MIRTSGAGFSRVTNADHVHAEIMFNQEDQITLRLHLFGSTSSSDCCQGTTWQALTPGLRIRIPTRKFA